MTRVRSESGQVVPLALVAMLGILLGICALVIDVGAWYESSRKLQSVADAAALAAVQDLPASPSTAVADAQSYANANGRPLTATPVISSTFGSNDTVSISTSAQAPLFFARAIGITSATVHARATASVAGVSTVQGQGYDENGTGRPIPLVVSASAIPPASSFGQEVTLSWGAHEQLGSGEFGLIDLSQGNSNGSPKVIADWIDNGYPGTLGTGSYPAINGNKMQSAPIDNAMSSLASRHTPILLPVYTVDSNGSYSIAGWAGFIPDSWNKGSGQSTLTGKFTHLDLHVSGPPAQYFGAGHLGLTG